MWRALLRRNPHSEHVLVDVTRHRVARLVIVPRRAVAGPTCVDMAVVRSHTNVITDEGTARRDGLAAHRVPIECWAPVPRALYAHSEAALRRRVELRVGHIVE